MACILCLETEMDNKTCIQIFSDEGENLRAKSIILKHFWIEPKEDDFYQWICGQCWHSLLEFHEFYERIEEAHKAFHKANEEENVLQQDAKTRNTTVTKGTRGRPKSATTYDNSNVLQETTIDTVMSIVEDLNMDTVESVDVFSEESTPLQTEMVDDSIIEFVKVEKITLADETNVVSPKRKRGRPRGPYKKIKKNIPTQSHELDVIEEFLDKSDEECMKKDDFDVDSLECVDVFSENSMALHTEMVDGSIIEFVKVEEITLADETDVISSKRKRGRPRGPYKKMKNNIPTQSHNLDVIEEFLDKSDEECSKKEDLDVDTLDNVDVFSEESMSLQTEMVDDSTTEFVKVEEITLADETDVISSKRKRGRPRGPYKKMKNNIPTQSTSNQSIKPELDSDDIEEFLDKSDEECTKKDSKKNYIERRNLSLEFDEFIAKNYKLTCCLCQLPLEDFTQLKTHFRTEHKIRGYALCCGKKLLKRGLLVDHIRTHLDPEYFKCTECGKVMSDRRCLEGHMKIHEEKGQPSFKCEICSKSYHRRVVYLRHVQNHVPEEMREFECPECAKRFATHYLMNQHHKIVHLNTYSKICDICGKKIHGREALQRHQALHDEVPPPPIQCELCGLIVTTKYGLTRHMKSKHIADYQQPQACPYCPKVSPNFFAQKRHIYYMHNIGRRHACPICEKAFKRSKDLREHMTTHTGDVLYSCPYCPKTFNSDANMYAHRKKVHRKEWEQKMKEKFPLAEVKGELTTSAVSQSEPDETFFG